MYVYLTVFLAFVRFPVNVNETYFSLRGSFVYMPSCTLNCLDIRTWKFYSAVTILGAKWTVCVKNVTGVTIFFAFTLKLFLRYNCPTAVMYSTLWCCLNKLLLCSSSIFIKTINTGCKIQKVECRLQQTEYFISRMIKNGVRDCGW